MDKNEAQGEGRQRASGNVLQLLTEDANFNPEKKEQEETTATDTPPKRKKRLTFFKKKFKNDFAACKPNTSQAPIFPHCDPTPEIH